jgi:hypothetical protein
MLGGRAEQGRTVAFICAAFRARDKCSAKLRRYGSELERRSDTLPIHDAACGDDREPRALSKQSREREGAKAIIARFKVEDA